MSSATELNLSRKRLILPSFDSYAHRAADVEAALKVYGVALDAKTNSRASSVCQIENYKLGLGDVEQ